MNSINPNLTNTSHVSALNRTFDDSSLFPHKLNTSKEHHANITTSTDHKTNPLEFETQSLIHSKTLGGLNFQNLSLEPRLIQSSNRRRSLDMKRLCVTMRNSLSSVHSYVDHVFRDSEASRRVTKRHRSKSDD
jgi:hypothetical protein